MTVPETPDKHLLWLSWVPRGQFKYQRLREINEACQRASLCILPRQEWNWVEEFHFLQITAIKFATVQRNKRRFILRPKLGWACACILRFIWATPRWVSPIGFQQTTQTEQSPVEFSPGVLSPHVEKALPSVITPKSAVSVASSRAASAHFLFN